jgi:quinol monooxygenase YgiN
MITRIVKLTISPSKKEEFRTIFITNKEHIRSFEGCLHVELLQDKKYENIFFTYSKWEGEEFIEKYRKSELFGGVWKKTKACFCAPPEAWSADELFSL